MRRYGWLILTLVLFTVAHLRDGVDRWVLRTQMPALVPDTAVEVRDRNGDLLRAYTVADGRWRLSIAPDAVDSRFIDMLIAYEDKRFYRHSGVDPIAITRAIAQAVRHGEVVSGGSTLTMQVARLLEESGTGAWRGKLRQIRVALALERMLSKQQILQLYLTLAPYGGNIEGVRAASLSYFGKEPKRLTAAQAALLVALPQAPEARRPDRAFKVAQAARQRVLDRLHLAGVVADEEAQSAHLEAVPRQRKPFPRIAPHLADRATRDAPDSPVHHLSVDRSLQMQAESLAANAVRIAPDRLSVAMIVADHHTGEVMVHVGSSGYSDRAGRQGFIDMTRAIRSPGSTLKPLVYALAFDQGLAHPATLINDRPVAFGTYAPQNFDGTFRGELTVTEALQLSLNIPVVLLTDEIGPARLTAALRAAGMSPRVPGGKSGLAVALGGVGVTLEDLVTLYAGLAQNGEKQALSWRIGPKKNSGNAFVSRASAWQVGHILAGLAPPNGASKSRLAYKTGTSYGHRDAWAIGFDGRYAAGVWMGRADGTAVPGVFGGDLAAPLLFQLMDLVSSEVTPLAPPPPETLLLENALLPEPLQRFRGRNAVFKTPADAPKLAFPPDGARLVRVGDGVTVKLRDGAPPFTWLVNGTPVLTRSFQRETELPIADIGFVNVSVIDAQGRSAQTSIRLD
ncbi:MAG: penicillin-binding protein 1C [Pseudomonadota bacterium]